MHAIPLRYLTPFGRTAAIAAVASLLAFPASGWHESLTCGVALGVILATSLLRCMIGIRLKASLSVSETRLTIGDDATITIRIDNHGPARTPRLIGDLVIGAHREQVRIAPLGAGDSTQLSIPYHAVRRMMLDIGPLVAWRGDPFGLTRREQCISGQLQVAVHPLITRVALPGIGVTHDDGETASASFMRNDFDIHALRAYEPGDDLRHVHWLSSAKSDALMIRQYEADTQACTAIGMDLDPSHYASTGEFELAVCAYASLGVACITHHRPLICHSGSPSTTRELLDAASAITPVSNHDRMPDPLDAHAAVATRCFILGSRSSPKHVSRRMVSIGNGALNLIVQVSEHGQRSVQRTTHYTLARLGSLEDLPYLMAVIA